MKKNAKKRDYEYLGGSDITREDYKKYITRVGSSYREKNARVSSVVKVLLGLGSLLLFATGLWMLLESTYNEICFFLNYPISPDVAYRLSLVCFGGAVLSFYIFYRITDEIR